MIKEVLELIDQLLDHDRLSIMVSFEESELWFITLLYMTFVDNAELVESMLLVRCEPEWTPSMIPLVMVNDKFDFELSYRYVVEHPFAILHMDSQLQTDGYIDAGGPMRLWVEQMLGYITEYNIYWKPPQLAKFDSPFSPTVVWGLLWVWCMQKHCSWG